MFFFEDESKGLKVTKQMTIAMISTPRVKMFEQFFKN